jgi:hypothetical protein
VWVILDVGVYDSRAQGGSAMSCRTKKKAKKQAIYHFGRPEVGIVYGMAVQFILLEFSCGLVRWRTMINKLGLSEVQNFRHTREMGDAKPIICDNGTGFVKCGYAGENFPALIVHTSSFSFLLWWFSLLATYVPSCIHCLFVVVPLHDWSPSHES